MKNIKRVFSCFMILALTIFAGLQVSAVGQLTPLKDQNGNIIYHIGNKSSEPVMIPTVYNQNDREFRGVWLTQLAGDIPQFNNKEDYFYKGNLYFDNDGCIRYIRILQY